MPRIRTIKPEFPEDEKLGTVSRDARLMFVTLWATCCDDHGRFRANPAYLRANLFPYDDVSLSTVDGWLEELAKAGRISLYVCAGERYAVVNNWEKHQRIDNAAKPIYPGPNDPNCAHSEWVCDHNRHPRPSDQGECASSAASLGEPPRVSANLGDPPLDLDLDLDHLCANAQSDAQPASSDDFAEFWDAYPRKIDRKRAATAWKRLSRTERGEALAALPAHIAAWRRSNPNSTQFIPHPTTWLHGRRWEDQVTSGRPQLRAVGAGGVEIDGAT